MKLIAASALAGLLATAYAASNSTLAVPYPAGYRKWIHVKTVLVSPPSQFFQASGGFHHIYANEKAMQGYTSGTFPDGSVLVFDLLDAKEKDGVAAEGKRQRIDVMLKDSRKFATSGGWGFERFLGDSATERPLTEEHRKECFDCHEQRNAHDLVFSEYRE